MKRFLLAFVLLISPVFLWADPPKLNIPAEIRPSGQYVELIPETDAVGIVYVGLSGIEPLPSRWLKDGRVFLLDTRGLATGRYQFVAVAASQTGEQARANFVLVIGQAPTPTPTPQPTPEPSPAPIPEVGFRVLIVYESAELSKLSKSQLSIFTSAAVREYLNAKCIKGPDGKTAEWRQWDFDVPLGGERDLWRKAMGRKPARDKLPWIVISNGVSGYEGPLPPNVSETLTLLKRFGG